MADEELRERVERLEHAKNVQASLTAALAAELCRKGVLGRDAVDAIFNRLMPRNRESTLDN